MEVSMPTGSLCAERNVIGTALSADITLRREDIKLVAVYSASMPVPTAVTSQSLLQRTGSANSVLERSASYTSTVGTGNCFSQGPGKCCSVMHFATKAIHSTASESYFGAIKSY